MALTRLAASLAAGALLALAPAVGAAAPGRAVVLQPVAVDGPIDGDVVAVGGDVHLGANADVRGDVVALFGAVERAPGARVGGRVLAVSSLSGLVLARGRSSRSQLGVRLLVAGLWLFVTTLIAAVAPRRSVAGSWAVHRVGWRGVVVGALVSVTLLAALIAALGSGPALTVPLTAAVMVVFMVGKAFGLVLVGAVVGRSVLAAVRRGQSQVTFEVFLGVGVLLVFRFLPVVGGVIWTVVSIWALGACVLGAALSRIVTPLGEAARASE